MRRALDRAGVSLASADRSFIRGSTQLRGAGALRLLPSGGVGTGGGPTLPEASVIRLLGFGHMIGEFLLAPLGLPLAARMHALHLCATLNLAVCAYDLLVDEGIGDPKWLAALVNGYFSRLERQSRHAARLALLRRTIEKMKDAEDGAGGIGPLHRWRRKCALPFVVMGLGGLACGPRNIVPPRGYLRWLYRTGLQFGIADDALDIAEDRRSGQFNIHLRQPAPSRRFAAEVARTLAEWDRWCPGERFANVRLGYIYWLRSWLE